TCVVAETPGRVSKIEPVSADLVRQQIEVALRSFPVAAIKTGLLFSAEIVGEIARALCAHRSIPLVVDPVMVATSGDALLEDDAIQSYERDLFPLAALVTPNLNEGARLSGRTIGDVAAMRAAGRALVEKYGVAVLLKGGHLSGNEAIDLLFTGDLVTEFSAPFSHDIATHGTGCTYSAAITAGLAAGLELGEAIQRAKKFVSAAIVQHHAWDGIHALNHSPKG
ncbi:MAG TPA: bifunctional hydroxymethylpyrimidine kinase/phosphomethylpyrimidine kinase, partial [Chthoniobacterales bacterium]